MIVLTNLRILEDLQCMSGCISSWIDWISDACSQRYTNLQSLDQVYILQDRFAASWCILAWHAALRLEFVTFKCDMISNRIKTQSLDLLYRWHTLKRALCIAEAAYSYRSMCIIATQQLCLFEVIAESIPRRLNPATLAERALYESIWWQST